LTTRSRRAALVLAPGRDRSVSARHPWIFSGAVARVEGDPSAGGLVEVRSHEDEALGCAAYSPRSQIRARMWTFDPNERVDAGFIERRVAAACAAREALRDDDHTAARLVHAESDGLPGVIADRYGDTVVVQLSSAGAEAWRDAIVTALARQPDVACLYERSDAEVRALEGLEARTGVLRGHVPRPLLIREGGLVHQVDIVGGQKTGFYLDQRDNRARVRAHSRGRRVLNAFCYTGGFTLAALAGGAGSVLSIDSAGDALAMARDNVAANPALDASRAEWREADVFTDLRRLRNEGARFDLIVLDPPKFAPTAAHAARAARAYKDINLLALKLLERDGLLATFSCSGGISIDLFQKIVAGAALDADADASILARLGASADHPVALAFPEGEYLKGLWLRKA
jgi:23S rRNA (cytosine1962-C5)-methyltransferase